MGDTERWHLVHDGHEHAVAVERGALVREARLDPRRRRGGAEEDLRRDLRRRAEGRGRGRPPEVRDDGAGAPRHAARLRDRGAHRPRRHRPRARGRVEGGRARRVDRCAPPPAHRAADGHRGGGRRRTRPGDLAADARPVAEPSRGPTSTCRRSRGRTCPPSRGPTSASRRSPWPDVDLPDLPPWVDTVRKFAIPILIAFFIARGEVKRRRKAEEKKALDRESPGDSRASGATDSRS